jgi:hypothetical protein
MTLAATVARSRNIPGHCEDKKSLKMGKTTHFQTLVIPEKNFPSIMAGTNLEHKS